MQLTRIERSDWRATIVALAQAAYRVDTRPFPSPVPKKRMVKGRRRQTNSSEGGGADSYPVSDARAASDFPRSIGFAAPTCRSDVTLPVTDESEVIESAEE